MTARNSASFKGLRACGVAPCPRVSKRTTRRIKSLSAAERVGLPTLEISKPDQVVTVIRETTGETISSIRIKGARDQPRVPVIGLYRIEVGEGTARKTIRSVRAEATNGEVLRIDF